MKRLARRLGVVVLGFGFLGCGSNSEATAQEPHDAGMEAGYTDAEIMEACRSFAAGLCESMASCCMDTHGVHDAEACQAAFERNVCRPGASAVTAGFAEFFPEAAEPCLDAYARAFSTCQADWDQITEIRKELWTQCRILVGTVERGRGCTTSVTCARAAGATTSSCTGSVCRELSVLAEGAECPFPIGDVSTCDVGLYCDAPAPEQSGHCVPRTSVSEACAATDAANSCGLGYFCDADSVCQKAVNFGGGSCTDHGQCVSFNCDLATGECDPAAIVSEATCVGG